MRAPVLAVQKSNFLKYKERQILNDFWRVTTTKRYI